MSTISTLGQSILIRDQVLTLQGKIQTLQTQTTTGYKATVYGDLGSQASIDIDLRNQGARIDTFQTNISLLQSRAQIVDQNLSNIRDTAQSLHDLTVKAGNNDEGRQAIIAQANAAVTQIT